MGGTVLACRDVLARTPLQHEQGYEVWDHVKVGEVLRIVAAMRYADGLTAAEVAALAEAFPPPHCWWSIERDY